MKITFSTLTDTERATTFGSMDNAALAAALTQINTEAEALFALDAPSVDQVAEAETLVASKALVVAEQATRAAAVKDAEKRFAAARASFSINEGVEEGEDNEVEETDESESTNADEETEESDEDAEVEGDEDAEVEAAGENPFDKKKKKVDSNGDPVDDKSMTASGAQRINPAKGTAAAKVGRKSTRPAVKAATPITITAAADVPGFATGSKIADMTDVAKAVIARVKGFSPYNARSAQMNAEANGGAPMLNPFGVASFGLDHKTGLTAQSGPGAEYDAVKFAIKDHNDSLVAAMKQDKTLTAAGWCAPSTIGYTWLADYVVDGLLTMPETDAPRGGLMTTTGPALADQYAQNGSDFGFVQTEAQAEAGAVKTCETIVCPDFIDHRLDAMGYCWKIPILTNKAYPELVADALRLSSVLYAHKQNTRFITDIVAGSTAINAVGLGATMTDTLEALTIVAVKERRHWNLGENAVMEVKMPVWAKEVFRADISRRQDMGVETVTDQQINAQFTARNLAPEYVTDWQDLTGNSPVFSASFQALIYPAGTWVKVVEDVINLSAVYDAASLSVNEYTGVFFEQGIMTFKAGYRSHVVTIPVCTAGLVGAAILDCHTESTNYSGQKQTVVA